METVEEESMSINLGEGDPIPFPSTHAPAHGGGESTATAAAPAPPAQSPVVQPPSESNLPTSSAGGKGSGRKSKATAASDAAELFAKQAAEALASAQAAKGGAAPSRASDVAMARIRFVVRRPDRKLTETDIRSHMDFEASSSHIAVPRSRIHVRVSCRWVARFDPRMPARDLHIPAILSVSGARGTRV